MSPAETYDTNFKMNPPLRTAADVKACIEGVKDGTIDILATDHAPHLAEEKELEFPFAPFGIIMIEWALGLYIKALVEPGHIDWMKLIDLMSTQPGADRVAGSRHACARARLRTSRSSIRTSNGRWTSSSGRARAATARSMDGS